MVGPGVMHKFGNDRARQFPMANPFVGDVVKERNGADKAQAAIRFRSAMARDTFGVEDRLYIGGIMDHLARIGFTRLGTGLARRAS